MSAFASATTTVRPVEASFAATELGSQGFAALAESNDQGVGGDSGGGAGCADGIGCADGHGYFLTYSSDKSALC